jgi:hypothetical protein
VCCWGIYDKLCKQVLGEEGGDLLHCFEWGCIVLLNLVLDFSIKPASE